MHGLIGINALNRILRHRASSTTGSIVAVHILNHKIRPATAFLAALVLALHAAPQLVYPFGHDQGIFSACGEVIRRGGVPIRDCFESKGPAVMVLYALAMSIAPTTVTVHAFTLVWQALTALLVGLAARMMFHRWAAWPAAAAYWLMYAGIHFWSMNQAETFTNLFIVSSVLCAWQGGRTQGSSRAAWLAMSGISAGVLLWFKYTFALQVLAIGAGVLAQSWWQARTLRGTAPRFAPFVVGGLGVNASVLGWFAAVGGLPALVEQFLIFRELFPLGPPRTLPEIIQMLWRFTDNGADLTADYKPTVAQWTLLGGGFPALLMLGAIGALWGIQPSLAGTTRDRRFASLRVWYWVSLFVAGLVVVAVQAKYVQYHFTILHPSLAVLSGAGVAVGAQALQRSGYRRVWGTSIAALTLAAFVPLMVRMWPWMRDTYINVVVERKSLRAIHEESRVAAQLYIADYIRQTTNPADTISIFGDAPWVYVLSERRNATRFPFADVWAPAHGSWTNATFGKQFFEQIAAHPPKLFILTADDYPWIGVRHIDNWKYQKPLHEFVESNYCYEAEIGPFLVFRRRTEGS